MDRTANIEKRFLLISVFGNLSVGVAGITLAWLTGSQAIMLDGLFNITYFRAGLFALKVARLLQRGDDARYPFGYIFYEPLINGLKGALVLGISIAAAYGAVEAIFAGGRSIGAELAIAYGIFATVVCWGMAIATHMGFKRTASPLLGVDAKNWIINAAISSCVMLAFLCIPWVRRSSFSAAAEYIDPGLVLTVIIISISVPIRMARDALRELLHRSPDKPVVDKTREIIAKALSELPVGELFVRVIQSGRTRIVLAHAVLPDDYAAPISAMDEYRAKVLADLNAAEPGTILDLTFIANRYWGAPSGETTEN